MLVSACVYRKPKQAPPAAAAQKPVVQGIALPEAQDAPACLETGPQRAAILDDALRRYGKAQALAKSGDDKDLKAATDLLTRLTQDYPWFAPAHTGLGSVQATRGNWTGAYTAYKRRLLFFSSHPADRERAMAELRLLEERQPALRTYAEGEKVAKDRNWPKAAELMQVVIQQKPQFALAHRLLGDALAQQSKRTEAIAAYEQYVRLDPFSPDRPQVEHWLTEQKAK